MVSVLQRKSASSIDSFQGRRRRSSGSEDKVMWFNNSITFCRNVLFFLSRGCKWNSEWKLEKLWLLSRTQTLLVHVHSTHLSLCQASVCFLSAWFVFSPSAPPSTWTFRPWSLRHVEEKRAATRRQEIHRLVIGPAAGQHQNNTNNQYSWTWSSAAGGHTVKCSAAKFLNCFIFIIIRI